MIIKIHVVCNKAISTIVLAHAPDSNTWRVRLDFFLVTCFCHDSTKCHVLCLHFLHCVDGHTNWQARQSLIAKISVVHSPTELSAILWSWQCIKNNSFEKKCFSCASNLGWWAKSKLHDDQNETNFKGSKNCWEENEAPVIPAERASFCQTRPRPFWVNCSSSCLCKLSRVDVFCLLVYQFVMKSSCPSASLF